MEAYVQTVTGPVPAASLSFILPHEHVGIGGYSSHGRDPWDWWAIINDEDLLADELLEFKRLGGSCIVDMSNIGLGRNPELLRRLSVRTGVPIVMGAGWYRGSRATPESFIERRMVNDLAEEIVREFSDGVGTTGIKPGIIGEVGTDKAWVNPTEERVFRAVARASRATGLAVLTHAMRGRVGLDELSILLEEGVDPSRIVVHSVCCVPYVDYFVEILQRGAYLEIDYLGIYSGPVYEGFERRVIGILLQLLDRGYVERILISHDFGVSYNLRGFGGHGYTYVPQVFLPKIRAQGVSEEAIHQMTVLNPRQVLSLS